MDRERRGHLLDKKDNATKVLGMTKEGMTWFRKVRLSGISLRGVPGGLTGS